METLSAAQPVVSPELKPLDVATLVVSKQCTVCKQYKCILQHQRKGRAQKKQHAKPNMVALSIVPLVFFKYHALVGSIDSAVGYTKSNVHIISWKANRIKNNGTADDLIKIGTYIKALEHMRGH